MEGGGSEEHGAARASRYASFTIKVEVTTGPPRGKVRHLQSGAEVEFESFGELEMAIQTLLDKTPQPDAGPSQEDLSGQ